MANIDIYTTIQGDTWDIIAFKVYGNEKYMTALAEANPAYCDVVFFSAGVELIAPDIAKPLLDLPPWKRGE